MSVTALTMSARMVSATMCLKVHLHAHVHMDSNELMMGWIVWIPAKENAAIF